MQSNHYVTHWPSASQCSSMWLRWRCRSNLASAGEAAPAPVGTSLQILSRFGIDCDRRCSYLFPSVRHKSDARTTERSISTLDLASCNIEMNETQAKCSAWDQNHRPLSSLLRVEDHSLFSYFFTTNAFLWTLQTLAGRVICGLW